MGKLQAWYADDAEALANIRLSYGEQHESESAKRKKEDEYEDDKKSREKDTEEGEEEEGHRHRAAKQRRWQWIDIGSALALHTRFKRPCTREMEIAMAIGNLTCIRKESWFIGIAGSCVVCDEDKSPVRLQRCSFSVQHPMKGKYVIILPDKAYSLDNGGLTRPAVDQEDTVPWNFRHDIGFEDSEISQAIVYKVIAI